MSAIEHLTIALSAEKVEQVRARVASGEYLDESAVVEEALAALEAMDGRIDETPPKLTEAAKKWLRAEVAAACDELDRDPSSAIPLDEVIAQFRAERIARGE